MSTLALLRIQPFLAALLVFGGAAQTALGQSSESAPETAAERRADELFERGKALLSAGDYQQACALLSESYQADPATGSLLALALCHERAGHTASAFQAYRQVALRARAEEQPERAQVASQRAQALEAGFSTLTIDVRQVEGAAGLEVLVDDVPLPLEQVGEPIPVDPGQVCIEVSADDRLPWRTSLVVDPGRNVLHVVAPRLEARPAPIAPVVAVRAASAEPKARPAKEPPPRDRRYIALRRAGAVVLTAGAVGVVAGGGLVVRAVRKDNDSEAGCVDDACTPAGRRDRLAARTAGNAATATLAVGGALVGAGVVAYLVARRRHDQRESRLRAGLWTTPQLAGVSFGGEF